MYTCRRAVRLSETGALQRFSFGRCWHRTAAWTNLASASDRLLWVPTYSSEMTPALRMSWIQRCLGSICFAFLDMPRRVAIVLPEESVLTTVCTSLEWVLDKHSCMKCLIANDSTDGWVIHCTWLFQPQALWDGVSTAKPWVKNKVWKTYNFPRLTECRGEILPPERRESRQDTNSNHSLHKNKKPTKGIRLGAHVCLLPKGPLGSPFEFSTAVGFASTARQTKDLARARPRNLPAKPPERSPPPGPRLPDTKKGQMCANFGRFGRFWSILVDLGSILFPGPPPTHPKRKTERSNVPHEAKLEEVWRVFWGVVQGERGPSVAQSAARFNIEFSLDGTS